MRAGKLARLGGRTNFLGPRTLGESGQKCPNWPKLAETGQTGRIWPNLAWRGGPESGQGGPESGPGGVKTGPQKSGPSPRKTSKNFPEFGSPGRRSGFSPKPDYDRYPGLIPKVTEYNLSHPHRICANSGPPREIWPDLGTRNP